MLETLMRIGVYPEGVSKRWRERLAFWPPLCISALPHYDACQANWGSDAFVFVMTNDKVTKYRHDYDKDFVQATCVATGGRGGTQRDSKLQTKERHRVTLHPIALSYK